MLKRETLVFACLALNESLEVRGRDNSRLRKARNDIAWELHKSRKPSRRELRSARKARKNLAMYKLAGRRPWDCGPFGEVLDSLTRHLGDGQRLRERSGFLDMSKLAEGMR